jgi:hypothetical protein
VDQRVVEHLKRDRDDLYDILGEVVAKERAAGSQRDQGWRRRRCETCGIGERRILQHIENHTEQCNHGIIVFRRARRNAWQA